MKQFIVLMAVLPILLLFLMQFSMDQRNSQRLGRIQDLIYISKESARQEGYFSLELKEKLREDLSRTAGVAPEEIVIECDDIIKYRYNSGEDRLIYYRIEVPIKKVMAGSRIFGITEEENGYTYVIDSYTASEKI